MKDHAISGFLIRKASSEDIDAIALLFDQYRMFYGQTSDLVGAESYLQDRVSSEESVIIAAWDGDKQAVGFTQLYPSFSSISMQKAWILNDLFVSEAFRSLGIARKLMEAARDFAECTGAKGLTLCTAKGNTIAQRLYESSGYVKDEEFFYYSFTL